MENIMKSLNLKEGIEVEYKSAKGGFPGSFWDTFSAFAVCRNPLLQKMFVFVGVGEKAGSGADVISTGWRENGWQLPTLVEHQMPARVEATLLIEDLVKQQEGETIQKSGLETGNDTESGLKSGLKTTQEKIVQLIRENPQISYTTIAEELGMARSGIAKQIQQLQQSGIIKRIGPDKGGHWEIVTPSSD